MGGEHRQCCHDDRAEPAVGEGVRQVELDALAAQFENHPLQGRRRLRCDGPPDGGRAGERHHVDRAMRAQEHTALVARLGYDVEDAGWQVGLLGRLAQHGGLQRRERTGAQYHRAAGQESRHDLPYIGDEREVVGGDGGDHAGRFEATDGQPHTRADEVVPQRHLVVLPRRHPAVEIAELTDAFERHTYLCHLGDAARQPASAMTVSINRPRRASSASPNRFRAAMRSAAGNVAQGPLSKAWRAAENGCFRLGRGRRFRDG